MSDTKLRDYIRKQAQLHRDKIMVYSAELCTTTDPATRAGKRAAILYCEGHIDALSSVMAYTGDIDGLRTLQAERESA